MSVPSVIFADASWYGSLRGAVEFGGGKDANFHSPGSRWGIKGSNEVSEGLSAVYRFETRIGTDATQSGALNYVGLSGGFGNLTLGRIDSASWNNVGVMLDGSWYYGNSHTTYKHGNAVSYSIDAGMASLQIDAIMDGGTDTGDAVDKLEFGMSFDLGEIGKVGLAYVDMKESKSKLTTTTYVLEGAQLPQFKTIEATPSTLMLEGGDVEYEPIMLTGMVTVDGEHNVSYKWTQTNGTNADKEYKDSATPMFSSYVMKSSGELMADGTVGKDVEKVAPMLATLWADSGTSRDGTASVLKSNYVVSGDTYSFKSADENGTDCTTAAGRQSDACTRYTVLVVQSQHEVDSATTDYKRFLIEQDDGSFEEVFRKDQLTFVTLGAASPTAIKVTSSVEVDDGSAGTDLKSVTLPSLTGSPGSAAGVEVDPENPGSTGMVVKKENTTYPVAPGSRDTHIAAQFNLGAVSAYLGHSQMESTDKTMDKLKVTHYGVSGGLGDTGTSFHIMARNKSRGTTSATGVYEGENPWLVGLTKSLGDGASAIIEHGNSDDGESGKTRLGLKVDF